MRSRRRGMRRAVAFLVLTALVCVQPGSSLAGIPRILEPGPSDVQVSVLTESAERSPDQGWMSWDPHGLEHSLLFRPDRKTWKYWLDPGVHAPEDAPFLQSATTAGAGGRYSLAQPGYGRMFFKGWVAITSVEVALLGVTVAMPREWTGWSDTFVADALENMGEAYTRPPVIDDDWWFHNYIGHPYGGSVYYNTVRSQGASPAQSFLFSTVLSLQWEYLFESFAERPSMQDIFITPITGSILGELTHKWTLSLLKGGVSFPEKVLIFVMNPMHVFFAGY